MQRLPSNDSDEDLVQFNFNTSTNSKPLQGDDSYPPDPVDSADRKSVFLNVTGYILVTEFCERLAYYGFAGNLVLFFQTQLGYSNADADVQYSVWNGLVYVTPLIGGYIADTYLGRYWTILIFCVIYVLGLVLVVLGSIPGEVSPAIFFPAIYIVALGTGGIKPNVSTMGADQFDDRYSQDRKEKAPFFNWFYWSVNLGSILSYSFVAYICQFGIPSMGGQRWGFVVGFSIPAIAMAVAIVVFYGGTAKYKLNQPSGSLLSTFFKICFEALWTRRTMRGTTHLLDRACRNEGGSFSPSQVESVKLVLRLLPFLGVMIPFWGIYSQMSTVFQNQACQMNLKMGTTQIPVTALNVFDSMAIIVLVPVFDQIIFPYVAKKGYPQSMLQRIGWGFLFALLSMAAAAFLEIYRLQHAPTPGNYYDTSARNNISPCQNIDNYNPYQYSNWYAGLSSMKPQNCGQSCDDLYTLNGVTYLNMTCIDCENIPQVADVSVMWQTIQFSLIGTAEILSSVASLEFFYSQAPVTMRSVTQSLNLLTLALASFVTIPLMYLVNSNPDDMWVPSNVDEGHLDYYFWLLASLMGLNMVVFYWMSKNYVYKTNADVSLSFDDEVESSGNRNGRSSATRSALHSVSISDDIEFELVFRDNSRLRNNASPEVGAALDNEAGSSEAVLPEYSDSVHGHSGEGVHIRTATAAVSSGSSSNGYRGVNLEDS